ncbi:MAG: tyrosine-protein phosphatase [Deltaproteobacteria bacterium]|nr:tyrosine-protein phosphatase [Deltaproteobacteria bacterium]
MKRRFLQSIIALLFSILSQMNLSFAETVFSPQGPLNFGVLINNEAHTIYRSAHLGTSELKKLWSYMKSRQLPTPEIVIHMNRHGFRRKFPMFSHFALQEYELSTDYGYEFYHAFHYPYRTYLDGEDPYNPTKNIDSSGYLGSRARDYFGEINDPEKDGGIEDFMRIMHLILSSQEPVLFHCTGGRHRTGIVGLTIRYLQGGEWINGKKRKVTVNILGPTLKLNPAQYEYYLHNKTLFRMKNINFIEKFQHDPRFMELQYLYRDSLNRP